MASIAKRLIDSPGRQPVFKKLTNGWVRYHGKLFTPKQWEAITAPPRGELIVIAGPGSGKSLVLVYRVVWLVERYGVDPRSILLLTFTVKAAREMLQRVAEALGPSSAGPAGGTFHSQCTRVLHRHGHHVGLAPRFKVTHMPTELRRLCKKLDLPSIFSSRIDDVVSIINKSRVEERPIGKIAETHHSLRAHVGSLKRLAMEYEKWKHDENRIDHADSIILVDRLLRERPSVRDELRAQFRHILVDEYQDTSRLQAAIADRLADGEGRLFGVGDPEQHIFAFASARRRNLTEFRKRHPRSDRVVLDRNFRSRPPVLEVAKALVHQMPEEDFTAEYLAGLKAHRSGGRLPILCEVHDEDAQAKFIVTKIRKLSARVPLGKIAVLVRHWDDLREIEGQLRAAEIPYVKRAASSLLNDEVVQHFLALVEYVADPTDRRALAAALQLCFAVGPAKVNKILGGLADGDDLPRRLPKAMDQLRCGTRLRATLSDFHQVIRKARKTAGSPAGVLRIGLGFYKRQQDYRWKIRKGYLRDLVRLAGSYSDLRTLLDDLAAARDEGDAVALDHVVLGTVHSTKGLEWEHVFIPNLIDRRFPDRRNGINGERRLLFVGITRTRERLYLVHPRSWRSVPCRLSPFVAAMPPTVFEHVKPGGRIRSPRS